MKSKYNFEFMELGDQIVAVPVGEGANIFHGVIKLNSFSAFVLKLLKDDIDENDMLRRLELEFDADTEVLKNALEISLQSFDKAGILEC